MSNSALSIEQAKVDLNKSRATIYRYLSDGKALGLFRIVNHKKRGMVGLYLTSRDRKLADEILKQLEKA